MAKPTVAPLTQERLKSLLNYNPETGAFTWLVKRGNLRAGSPAGGLNTAGYIQLMVDGSNHLAHRLAWLYMTGGWPAQDIDHRDGCKGNNQFKNLRDVSEIVNGHNRHGPNKNNRASGLIGVKRNRNRWSPCITVNGKQHHLGTFDTPNQAAAVRALAKSQAGLGHDPHPPGATES